MSKSTQAPALGRIGELTQKGKEIAQREQEIVDAALKIGITTGLKDGKWAAPTPSDKIKELLDYNRLLKRRARLLKSDEDILTALSSFGFTEEAAHIMPITLHRNEKNELIGFDKPVDQKQSTKAWVKIREEITSESGQTTYPKRNVSFGTTGNTVSGHGEITSAQLLRGIFVDPNWCVSYLIFPMSSEDMMRLQEAADDPMVVEEMERRRGVKAQLEEEREMTGQERFA